MLGQLVDLYLANNDGGENLYTAGGNSRVVSVYSPCGGAGKSTVAVNMAVQAALTGSSVFYLNLEPFSSSLNILSGQGDRCLSNILLHVHEDWLLPAKIQAFRVRDMKYNVDFFLPPESSAELSELDRQSTASLLLGLRRVAIYDLIIVDTDSALSPKNMAVLESSDGVVLLYTPEGICVHKMGVMLEDLKKLGLRLDHKTIQVINKYRGERDFFEEHRADFRIPLVKDAVLKNERTGFMEFTSQYAGHILSLTRMVLET
jgi:cellulose biosynthesis protein BcsQ